MPRLTAWVRREIRPFLEIAALLGFALVQPLFDVMGRSPDFFLFRRADRVDIVLLAVLVTVVPALVLWGAEAVIAAFAPRSRHAVHLVIVLGLLVAIALQVVKKFGLEGAPVLIVGVLLGAGAAFVFAASDTARLWVKYASPAPLLFAGLFLLFSPVSKLVLSSSVASAEIGGSHSRSPVVFIIFDEFPLKSMLSDGRIDKRFYPAFSELASTSTWFRNATTNSGFTTWSIPSLLSARYPEEKLAPTTSEFPNNVFTLLGGSYDMKVSELTTALCPPDICPPNASSGAGRTGLRPLLWDSFRVWRQIVSPNDPESDAMDTLNEATVRDGGEGADATPKHQPKDRNDATFLFGKTRPARFEEFIENLQPGEGPTLHYLHLLMPHQKWRYLPDGVQYQSRGTGSPRRPEGVWLDGGWPLELMHRRHVFQAVRTDQLVRQLIDRMKKTGLWDRSMVVITSDHGIAFEEGQKVRGIDSANGADVAWIPFFVKRPHQREGKVDDRPVELVDLLPTIADGLGIDMPFDTDGLSAFGKKKRDPERKRTYVGVGNPTEIKTSQWFPEVLRGTIPGLLPPATNPDELLRFGPHLELLGTSVADHPSLEAAGRIQLDDAELYRKVDPASGIVPALFSGTITSTDGLDGEYTVAVALNGVIAAVSPTYNNPDGALRFSSVAASKYFRPGDNKIQVFAVQPGSGGVTVRPFNLG